jgi:hypothetical protein
MRRMGLALVAAVTLGLTASGAQAKMEGKFRDGFVRGARNSCLAKQKTEAANSQISENLLDGYCTCAANYMADNAKPDDMMLAAGDVQRGNPPAWLADLSKQASRYCVTNLRDYVKAN